ncbi:MAG: hypothetical protein AAF492_27350, partial [Verrucomicrobiota bacterium]
DRELAEDTTSWAVQRWNYRWTQRYGSKDYSVVDPEKVGHDPVPVARAHLLPDEQSVFLSITNLIPVMQMEIKHDLETVEGDEAIGAIHHTIHAFNPEFDIAP